MNLSKLPTLVFKESFEKKIEYFYTFYFHSFVLPGTVNI